MPRSFLASSFSSRGIHHDDPFCSSLISLKALRPQPNSEARGWPMMINRGRPLHICIGITASSSRMLPSRGASTQAGTEIQFKRLEPAEPERPALLCPAPAWQCRLHRNGSATCAAPAVPPAPPAPLAPPKSPVRPARASPPPQPHPIAPYSSVPTLPPTLCSLPQSPPLHPSPTWAPSSCEHSAALYSELERPGDSPFPHPSPRLINLKPGPRPHGRLGHRCKTSTSAV